MQDHLTLLNAQWARICADHDEIAREVWREVFDTSGGEEQYLEDLIKTALSRINRPVEGK